MVKTKKPIVLGHLNFLVYVNKLFYDGGLKIDLLCKSMDWFLYDRTLCHERVNAIKANKNNYFFTYSIWETTFETVNIYNY